MAKRELIDQTQKIRHIQISEPQKMKDFHMGIEGSEIHMFRISPSQH